MIGSIAWYNLAQPPAGPDRSPVLMRSVLTRRLRVEGFLVVDHAGLDDEFRREVGALVRAGSLKFKEHIVVGLEHAPRAFIDLLAGGNFGKLLVQVGPDPTR